MEGETVPTTGFALLAEASDVAFDLFDDVHAVTVTFFGVLSTSKLNQFAKIISQLTSFILLRPLGTIQTV